MKIHIVQKGDTLGKIAERYGINLEELKAFNTQLTNPDKLMPGMKVRIPTTGGTVKKEKQVKEKPQQKMTETEHPFIEYKPPMMPVQKEMPAPPKPPKKEEHEKIMKEKPKPKLPQPSLPKMESKKEYVMKEEKPVKEMPPYKMPAIMPMPCYHPCPPLPCGPVMPFHFGHGLPEYMGYQDPNTYGYMPAMNPWMQQPPANSPFPYQNREPLENDANEEPYNEEYRNMSGMGNPPFNPIQWVNGTSGFQESMWQMNPYLYGPQSGMPKYPSGYSLQGMIPQMDPSSFVQSGFSPEQGYPVEGGFQNMGQWGMQAQPPLMQPMGGFVNTPSGQPGQMGMMPSQPMMGQQPLAGGKDCGCGGPTMQQQVPQPFNWQQGYYPQQGFMGGGFPPMNPQGTFPFGGMMPGFREEPSANEMNESTSFDGFPAPSEFEDEED